MMMEKPKIYLETTMFSFFYEERIFPPYLELKAEVQQIFNLIKEGEYEPFTSIYATDEIMKEPNIEKRERMKALISGYGVTILPTSDEVRRITSLYIQEKAISSRYITDAAHIAITTVNGLDFIVSLNFTHIARPWTIERVRIVNGRENYKGVGIYQPREVLAIYEDSTRLHE
jgi:hypothetical protein